MATKVTASSKAGAPAAAKVAAKKPVAKKPAVSAAEAARVSKPLAVPPTAPAPLDASGIPSAFPVGLLESIDTHTRAGMVFRLDNGFLEALRMQVRRIERADGTSGFELQFRIAGPSRAVMEAQLAKKGAESRTFEFHGAEPKPVKGQTVLRRNGQKTELSVSSYGSHKAPGTSGSPSALRLEGKNWSLELLPSDSALALRGLVRLEVTGDAAACNAAIEEAIDKAGLQPAFAPVTEAAMERHALMKLLWRTSPKKAKELAGKGDLSSLKPATVRKALLELGVSEARIEGLRYQKVAPGHFTVVDPILVKEMKAAGLAYAYSTVTEPAHVLSMLEEGQKATVERWSEGMLITGMSSMTDVATGGALGVFSRLVPAGADGRSWAGRTYKIILRPELLGRCDIWGWPGDYYGRGWDLTEKNFGVELLESVGTGGGYQSYNEIITPYAIGPEYIGCVVATTADARKKLIEHLKKAGYTPPEGQALASFVRLSPNIDKSLLEKGPESE